MWNAKIPVADYRAFAQRFGKIACIEGDAHVARFAETFELQGIEVHRLAAGIGDS